MCGIAGMISLNGAPCDPQSVLRAAHLMRHRGPDGEGYVLIHRASGQHSRRRGPDTPADISDLPIEAPCGFAPDVILAQRRLAIIDLSAGGHEPMTAGDGWLWLTFNGEIYNYVELREELRALGCTFRTDCDAEVILQGYATWGIACLQRFIGMFAFALYDAERRRLWCVRDRFGVKPFYYAHDGRTFTFASEMKAFQALLPAAPEPDLHQLLWFLQTGGVYNPPHTFFQGICELPGSHYLLVEDGRVSEPVRWWDVDLERARATYNQADPEGELLRLMSDSVRLRLRSDVPVGTCLSGGLDSSTIVSLAATGLRAQTGGRMNTFSAIYSVKGLDERPFVDIMTAFSDTIRHETTPTADGFVRTLERLTWHQDIPTASPTLYSQYSVMALAHGIVTVLLDGQGADELLGGYLSHVVFHLQALRRRDPLRFVRESAAFSRELVPRFFPYLDARQVASRIRHAVRHGRLPPGVLTAEAAAVGAAREHERDLPTLATDDALNAHLYRAVMRDSIPALLHYEDRNSMAFGIEARVPFLDHRVAEFALSVPGDLKIRGGETKVFARRAFAKVLPREIAFRRDKLGYPTPFGTWLRSEDALREDVRAILFDGAARRPWCDANCVQSLWTAHLSGAADHSRALYALMTAELWLRLFAT
jgi:asparagine synthase (glutamine-hydrolysing)